MSEEKKDYFNLSEAVDELRHDSLNSKEKAVSGLKLIGKGFFNAVKYTTTEILPELIEQAAKTNERTSTKLLKRDDLSDEKIERLKEIQEQSISHLKVREEERKELAQEQAEQDRQREDEKLFLNNDDGDSTDNVDCQSTIDNFAAQDSSTAQSKDVVLSKSNFDDTPLIDAQKLLTESIEPEELSVQPAPISFAERPDLRNYLSKIGDNRERIYVGKNIPIGKLKNAIDARPVYVKNGQALLLIDDTVFGSGKDGLLITDEYISFKQAFSDSINMYFIGASKFFIPTGFKFSLVAKHDIDSVYSEINNYFADLIAWHERAAVAGDVKSQLFLSGANGDNYEQNFYWLIRAIKSGNGSAQHNLGMKLKATAPQIAMQWFRLAAAQGIKISQQILEGMVKEGLSKSDHILPIDTIVLAETRTIEYLLSLGDKLNGEEKGLLEAFKRSSKESE